MNLPTTLDNRERDLLQVPLSALEHYAYCPRQSGLILLEDAFTDDAATIRGTLLHQRVDTPGNRGRGSIRTLHALPVWNDSYGLTGICDTVELHADGAILPVEHKSGRYQPGGPADIQAAAQAICLEEMFHRPVPKAAIYSATDRRRHSITVNDDLRTRVHQIADNIRAMLTTGSLPPPTADSRCRRCSMATGCMPKVLAGTRRYHQALTDLYTPTETQDDGR
ncbi:CRISPR-associated protein Cas4 [Streptomyces noursei]|uniref:CRISPR-associated protein Cas4 n=1 Tax=Streptomyces noursei TaxID=1971 RepID=UPI003633DB67